MKIGIYTPIHKINTEQLDFLVESLRDQTYQNYKWLVILNGEARNAFDIFKERYKDLCKTKFIFHIVEEQKEPCGIGLLKGELECSFIQDTNEKYDILLELDYDDVLHPTCLEELVKAAENNPKAQFFYSNFAHFNKNKATESATYGEYYGWNHRKHKSPLFNLELNEMIAFSPKPQYIQRIESAPNHLRAFRPEAYIKVGGYNKELEVGDDHDLMCKFYLEYGEKGFHHINKCLYYQRYDRTSTTFTKNTQIQNQVELNYHLYTTAMFEKWSNDNGHLIINSLDNYDIELKENTIGVLTINRIPQNITSSDFLYFLNEAYKKLVPGGLLKIEIPNYSFKSEWIDLINRQTSFQKRIAPHITKFSKSISHLIAFKDWYKDNYWGQPPNNF